MKAALGLKVAVYSLLVPGTVMLYVPYHLLTRFGAGLALPEGPSGIAACLLIAAGIGVYLRCAWDFATRGGGTPAPTDPPRHLVIQGLYRWTRNPMYHGVLLALFAQAWLFSNRDLLGYALGTFVVLHLFVVLYEERALAARFGASYEAYRAAVPRWGVTLRPYRPLQKTSDRASR